MASDSRRSRLALLVELHVDLGALGQAQGLEDILGQGDDDAVASLEDLVDQMGSTPGGFDEVHTL